MHHRVFTIAASALVLLLSVVHSSPTPVTQPKAVRIRQISDAPEPTACGDVIDLVNQGYAYFYATDAYDCLRTVPFNAAVATRFVDYINDTIQFQSTLAYLKSPPAGYQQPSVDVLGDLLKIKNNVTAGVYKNQYQFETDLQYLLYKTHDAHLYLTAGISAAFTFLAPFSITAASTDGKSLPKVYVTDDVIKARNESWKPSAIKSINGEDAVTFFRKFANLNSFGGIEAHTDWNQLFDMPALYTTGGHSIWEGNTNFFPGDEIKIVVENGTEYLDYWLAIYNEPYSTGPLTTGGDFYNYFVLGLLPASWSNATDGFYNAAYRSNSTISNNTTPTKNSWTDLTYGAYPAPDTSQNGLALLQDGIVSGYFLREIDTAVLSIPSFGQSGYAIGNFSEAISDFISNVTEANITRVVIDLQQNRGGTVELAFSIFKRFFPQDVPFAASRRRTHKLGNTLGEAYTNYFKNLTTDDPSYFDFLADEWVITPRLNAATGKNFSSWAEYEGPIAANGDTFSLVERYNLSSFNFDAALFEGWVPLGYTPEAPVPNGYRQPFATKNIVLLTDGICSSTCALLAEMFTYVGVKTITAGGLPVTGPMQAVGGNRGAAAYSAAGLDRDLLQLSSLNLSSHALAGSPPLMDDGTRDSGVFTTVLAVNLRDQMRASEATPLQFKYEAADCRIFYTLDNVFNMSRLWRDAATAAFDNRALCVEGSTGFTNSSRSAPEPLRVPSTPKFDFGAPDTVLTGHGLDLSGGLKGASSAVRSNQITPCDSGCSGIGSQCISVQLSSCAKPGQLGNFERCVPFTKDKLSCPAGTEWRPETSSTLKGFSVGTRVSTLSSGTKQFALGPCIPSAQDSRFCG